MLIVYYDNKHCELITARLGRKPHILHTYLNDTGVFLSCLLQLSFAVTDINVFQVG